MKLQKNLRRHKIVWRRAKFVSIWFSKRFFNAKFQQSGSESKNLNSGPSSCEATGIITAPLRFRTFWSRWISESGAHLKRHLCREICTFFCTSWLRSWFRFEFWAVWDATVPGNPPAPRRAAQSNSRKDFSSKAMILNVKTSPNTGLLHSGRLFPPNTSVKLRQQHQTVNDWATFLQVGLHPYCDLTMNVNPDSHCTVSHPRSSFYTFTGNTDP